MMRFINLTENEAARQQPRMPRIGVSDIPDNLNNGGRNEKDIYGDSS